MKTSTYSKGMNNDWLVLMKFLYNSTKLKNHSAIMERAAKMAQRFMQPEMTEKYESVALSHKTVGRRIDVMANLFREQ